MLWGMLTNTAPLAYSPCCGAPCTVLSWGGARRFTVHQHHTETCQHYEPEPPC